LYIKKVKIIIINKKKLRISSLKRNFRLSELKLIII